MNRSENEHGQNICNDSLLKRFCRDLLANKTNLFRNFKTKSRKQINLSRFVLYNTFLKCCSLIFLNKTEIEIIKMQSPGHNAYTSTVKTEDMSMSMIYDQTIRTKQSLLASRRNYNKAMLWLLPLLKHLLLLLKSIYSCSNHVLYLCNLFMF